MGHAQEETIELQTHMWKQTQLQSSLDINSLFILLESQWWTLESQKVATGTFRSMQSRIVTVLKNLIEMSI